MKELAVDELRIVVSHTRSDVRVDWHGQSRVRNPDERLAPFLAEIVESAAGSRMPLDVHLEEMAYSNSATITTIMRFVKAARDRNVVLVIS